MDSKVSQKQKDSNQGFFTQAALLFESVFILMLGVLTGILMPDDVILNTRQMVSNSWLHPDLDYLKYTLFLLSVFVIFHQHFCWMWLVKISNRVFSKKDWGEIYFIYTCVGLFLFSICFGVLQIFYT
jgi:hypothetical protein